MIFLHKRQGTEESTSEEEKEEMLKVIQQRVAELSTKLTDTERSLTGLSQQREQYRNLIDHYRGVEDDLQRQLGKEPIISQSANTKERDFSSLAIADAAELLLKEKQPLSSRQIYEKLTQKGKVFKGKTPVISVSGSMDRDSRFIAEKKGRERFWRLKIQSNPIKAENPSTN